MEYMHNIRNILFMFYVCLCQHCEAIPTNIVKNHFATLHDLYKDSYDDQFNTVTDYPVLTDMDTTTPATGTEHTTSTTEYFKPAHTMTPMTLSSMTAAYLEEKNSTSITAEYIDEAKEEGNATFMKPPAVARRSSIFQNIGFPQHGDIPILNRKIFRGTRVGIREHPYIVNIRRKESHYLVGSILSRNVVVTVAHPLIDVPVSELTAITGENYSDRGINSMTVILLLIHENYDPNTLSSDIALLRMFEEMVLGSNCKSISVVMYTNKYLNGETAFVTGWGRCDFSGRELCLPRSSVYYPEELVDPMLRTVNFPFALTNSYCKEYAKHDVPLDYGMLCVGVARKDDTMTPCLAVPGAPLVVKGRLLGIQSWGFGCGYEHDMPLIYTDLRAHISWLTYNLRILRKVQQSDLIELFKATRAVVLMDWLNKTREFVPPLHKHHESNYQPLPVDKILAQLSAIPSDVRDTILNKTYRETKAQIFIMYQNHYQYLLNLTNVTNQWNTTKHHAFLNPKSFIVFDFDKLPQSRVEHDTSSDDDELEKYKYLEIPIDSFGIPEPRNTSTEQSYINYNDDKEWESRALNIKSIKPKHIRYEKKDDGQTGTTLLTEVNTTNNKKRLQDDALVDDNQDNDDTF